MRKLISSLLSVVLLVGLTPRLCLCNHSGTSPIRAADGVAGCCGTEGIGETSHACPSCCEDSHAGSDTGFLVSCSDQANGNASCRCCLNGDTSGQAQSSVPGSESESERFPRVLDLLSSPVSGIPLVAGYRNSAPGYIDCVFHPSGLSRYITNHSIQC